MTLLIDGDHLFVYRIGFAVERDPLGMEAAKFNIRSALDRMINKTGDYKHIIYLTGKDNFRTNIATLLPYKGNRTGTKKPKYYNQIREYLVDKYDSIVVDGMEADDAIGIEQMKHYRDPEQHEDAGCCSSMIVACDKDMNMIPGWHYNPVKDEIYWISSSTAIYNFYHQCLTGDACDNIPGLKGIGPKGADKILKDCKTVPKLEIAVFEAYYKAMKLLKDHETTYELQYKGVTRLYANKYGFDKHLDEIKKLLWIRRE